jgi:hypothetical protein
MTIPPQPARTHLSSLVLLITLTTLTLLLSLFYARSYTTLHDQLGTWGCRMSWMSPNWVEMKVDGPGLADLEGKYGVYLYREGGLQVDSKVRRLSFCLLMS